MSHYDMAFGQEQIGPESQGNPYHGASDADLFLRPPNL